MSVLSRTAVVAHDYTLADIDSIAWAAVYRMENVQFMDLRDRHEAAWHQIAIELCTSVERPSNFDLYFAARRGVLRAADDENRHHGTPKAGPNRGKRNESPAFERYWRPVKDSHDGFTEPLVERLALPDALGVLTPLEYQAIITLAACDNSVTEAAAVLGIGYDTYYSRVQKARKRFKAAWYGEETPPSVGKPTDRCRSGHNRKEHGKQLPDGRWECQTCKRQAAARRRARSRPVAAVTERALAEAS